MSSFTEIIGVSWFRRSRAFKNRVRKSIFGPKSVRGERERERERRWITLHIEELNNLYQLFTNYFYGDRTKENAMGGTSSTHRNVINS